MNTTFLFIFVVVYHRVIWNILSIAVLHCSPVMAGAVVSVGFCLQQVSAAGIW